MIGELFTWMTRGLASSPVLTLVFAFGWGIASVLLSPCHLSSVPLIVGVLTAKSGGQPGKSIKIGLIFSLGIVIALALIGGITLMAGRLMGDIGINSDYLIGGFFIFAGLILLDIIRFDGAVGSIIQNMSGNLLLVAGLAGLLFGAALGPCTFAFLAPVLGVVLYQSEAHISYAAGLFFAFAAGHTLVIVAAALFTGALQKFLNWNSESRLQIILKKMLGLFVVFIGFIIIFH